MASVLSVNIGEPRSVKYRGNLVNTGIWKEPVEGRVGMRGINLEGDVQADRRVHGGVDKAVYAYSREDYDWWESELSRSMEPGTFGENLTTAGLDPSAAVIGEGWQIGSAVVESLSPGFRASSSGSGWATFAS